MRGKIFSLLFENFRYKLAALMLGALFWYFVQGEEILEVSQKLIVTLEPPEGYVVRDGETKIKDITIRGPRVLVGDMANKPPLEARIPLAINKTGNIRLRVDKEFIPDWDSRRSLTVHDEYLNIFVDEKIVRRVQVKEVLQGAAADGFIVEKVELKPNMVTLTGPKGDLSKIQEVLTEPIDISGLKQSKAMEAKLVPIGVELSALSVSSVQVNLQIGEQKVNRRFASIPIEFIGGDYLVGAKPRFVSIVIQGTPGVLNFVKKTDLRATVEVRDLTPGRYDKEVQLKIPPDTVLIETLPDKVNIEVYNQKRLN